jgi:GT2 family glycosyltransferase
MNPEMVSVIMVTRNRPVSLRKCLGRTRKVLPEMVKIIVFDDASSNATEIRGIIEGYSNTNYLRSEQQAGPTGGRNACLRAAVTPFCLCLDDDCFLNIAPDLSRWLEDRPDDQDIAVVGFRCFNQKQNIYAPLYEESGPAKAFHGGASLLRREAVLRAGGYLDWLVFACEDTELAMRLGRLGYRVWYDAKVIVNHDHSDESRDEHWASFYYVRNTLLINIIHGGVVSGMPIGLLRALRRGWKTVAPGQTWRGIFAGLMLTGRCFRARRELFASERRFVRS